MQKKCKKKKKCKKQKRLVQRMEHVRVKAGHTFAESAKEVHTSCISQPERPKSAKVQHVVDPGTRD